ncbi:MAG: helix-turn-helix domain-containing protein [Deltaproteobacteria bacterium]|nr:helix-turn-helix domain-containing protein [Deltaproteobacteria bacterium]
MKTLGQRIRELRGANDLSLREFAKKLGDLSAAFLSDVELGRRFPSDSVIAKMASVLGVSEEDLRSHDTRPPMDELRRLSSSDPMYGMALRKLVESRIGAKELIELLENSEHRRKTR